MRMRAAAALVDTAWRHRQVLWSTSLIEIRKRHAGSVLGPLWMVLQPALMLSIYLFVYLVMFKVRFPEFSDYDYVLFVFSGLIPYLGLAESIVSGTLSVKHNIHLVKNVMLPIDLVPVRAVLVGMAAQLVTTGLLIGMLAFDGRLTWHVLWLPAIMLLQYFLVLGFVLVLAAIAVVIVDVSYVINLALLLLMFLSPIGFRPEMVPAELQAVLLLNPLYYLIEAYRGATFYGAWPPPGIVIPLVGIVAVAFGGGAMFFHRFKGVLVDYE